MEFLEFLALSVINLGLIVVIIRKWGIISAEGFCMGYLGAAILTDNAELIFHYFVSPSVLHFGYGEFEFRIIPTAVHILGLIVLIAGLAALNLRPRPINRQLNSEEVLRLQSLGIATTVVGLFLTAVALYLVGALSAPRFYAALNAFRSQALPYGGFWYRGADITVFGLALTLPSFRNNARRFFGVLTLMMFTSFFLRTNKGGLEEPILWAAVVLYAYDRSFFKALFRARNVSAACLIAFLGMGAKLWFLPFASHRTEVAPTTISKFVDLATSTAATRWGDDSLYRGYCQFTNSLPDNRNLFAGSRVGMYVLTSWVPRLIYPDKPDHPFRGLGFMIYSDFHAFPSETPAPTLIGSVLADAGTRSLILYLFLAGLFLSALRIATTRSNHSLYRHVGYLFFVLFGGFSAEEGILGIVYTLFLAFGVICTAFLLELAWKSSKMNSGIAPIDRRFTTRAEIR
ncbi:MAG TPA: hypothetical protein VGT03_05625 [Candidatus Acidoferrales bacterium]|nr:hypothetical protein [Candidatus Acidoferrales bacterium]